jgi:hypothetical protein
MLSASNRKQLLRFCSGELKPEAFGEWVCETPGLEEEVGRGPYLDLVSADYRGREAGGIRESCTHLLHQHHPGALPRYRVTKVLEAMVRDETALLPGLRQLVRLRHDGCDFSPIAFVGFESETDTIPSPESYHLWEPAALAQVLAQANPYRRQIAEAASELLEDIRRRHPDDV